MKPRRPRENRQVIGWREWVALPQLSVERVKAKIDTGARTSSLHAFNIKRFESDGVEMVRFDVHPIQRDNRTSISTEARVFDRRQVKSSGGHISFRYVIQTHVRLAGKLWTIELTLANRDTMGFRMLLGRQAIRTRFVVDPGESFCSDDPPPPSRLKRHSSRKPS